MKKYFKIIIFSLVCAAAVCSLSLLPALAYTEPHWNMSYLTASQHYTDASGKTWYPSTAFYLPQFQTGVINADGKSTYYSTSIDGGMSWGLWRNDNKIGGILSPDNEPQSGYDYYYQFIGFVTNSDARYNNKNYYSGKFYVDFLAPAVSFSPACCSGSDKPVNVVISAEDTGSENFDGDDTGSGLNHFIFRLSQDNGKTWGAWSGIRKADETVTFSKPGVYKIEVQAWDNVGNMSDWVSGSYVVDEIKAGGSVSNTTGQYRTNTDVITSVSVQNSGGDITPDIGASVTFSIPGITSQTKGFVVPAGASEPVWFRWHTPSTPQNVNATININAGSSGENISAAFNIYELTEKTPPDPKGTDRANSYFQYESPREISTTPSASWMVYAAHQEDRTGSIWNPVKKKFDTYKYKVWVFTGSSYYASLSANLKVAPDIYCPTAAQDYGTWTFKSGYGINEKVSANVSTNDAGAVTGAQNVIGYYPEFMYDDTGYDFGGYDRIFETLGGGLNSVFDLKQNNYSMHKSHAHFVPVWWHDGIYQPAALVMDCWTPCGMLSAYNTDTINIHGCVFDDWHSGPVWSVK